MNFHLQFPIHPFPQKINYSHSFVFMGSCFSENISEIMNVHKFNVVENSHGVLYNPSSIAVALRRAIKNDWMTENELFFANDCWNSWEHHSRFSHPNKQKCLENINSKISETHVALKSADWLCITLGSAFVYKRGEQLVGNCHKQPQKEFVKTMLTSSEIIEEYTFLLKELIAFNPKLKVVFTISPVRYVRDGVVENNLSKARLIDAVHQLKNTKNVFYFPAYELILDDLRDYRFFKEDLVHPNEQAINYVFQKFSETNFDAETMRLFLSIKEIISAKNHRPFHASTPSHQLFLSTYTERCEKLKAAHPFLDFTEELNYFS